MKHISLLISFLILCITFIPLNNCHALVPYEVAILDVKYTSCDWCDNSTIINHFYGTATERSIGWNDWISVSCQGSYGIMSNMNMLIGYHFGGECGSTQLHFFWWGVSPPDTDGDGTPDVIENSSKDKNLGQDAVDPNIGCPL